MIIEVSRGSIKFEYKGNVLNIPGEMFLLENGKMGFEIFASMFDGCGYQLTEGEFNEICEIIRNDFSRGGHELLVN